MQKRRVEERFFNDRQDAGRYLAKQLAHLKEARDAVVLALPRGGVPVAYEIAEALHLPLDVFLVRKLGAPIYEELAMGAIASGGVRVMNDEVVRKLGISEEMIEAVTEEEERELHRREIEYQGDREPLNLEGKIAILVDDGLATGASMRAAVQALRQHHPSRIVMAVPVGAPETCALFSKEVDEVVCGTTPENFTAVGRWYADFRQTTDEEVCELLDRVAHRNKVQEMIEKHPERYSYFV